MKIIGLILLLIPNLFFARVCGWVEGVLDDTFYFHEKIAGIKKHTAYTYLRAWFWLNPCIIVIFMYSGLTLIAVEAILLLTYAFHFRFVKDGYYHITRNDLNKNVSPDRFKQNEDGLSGSFWDHILGTTYNDRKSWAIFATGCFLLLILFLLIQEYL